MDESDTRQYGKIAARVAQRLGKFVEQSVDGSRPVLHLPPIEDLRRQLDVDRLIAHGGMDAAGFDRFLDGYLAHTTRLHHPGSLAHQVAPPDMPAALADLVHGVLNNPTSLYEMGAAGVAIETAVVDWMLAKVGFDSGAGAGVLTHGGSLANLTALAAARAHAAPDAWAQGTPRDLVVLAPPSAHYSVTRAVALLGLGQDSVIELEVDRLGRILPARVPALLGRLAAAGRRPMALVAAACATGTGLYDDLATLASVCSEHRVWLHVDGAHGASALLSDKHRDRLDGIEGADSVIWDAHKMLRTSGLCAAVLLREGDRLLNAFRQEASYVFYDEDGPGIDTLDRTVECTKAPLGVKLFLNLAWRGERGLGAYVTDRYDCTARFARLIAGRPGFEIPSEPESNILCFRVQGGDDLQLAVRDRLLAEGRFHLSSAIVCGRRYLRITVTAPATDDATIERLLDRIEAIVEERSRRVGSASTAPTSPQGARLPDLGDMSRGRSL